MKLNVFSRLVREHKSLNSKISKLRLFLITNEFMELDEISRKLLVDQIMVMTEYSHILKERIRHVFYEDYHSLI